MKDYFNNQLKRGDYVAYAGGGATYVGIHIGIVAKPVNVKLGVYSGRFEDYQRDVPLFVMDGHSYDEPGQLIYWHRNRVIKLLPQLIPIEVKQKLSDVYFDNLEVNK